MAKGQGLPLSFIVIAAISALVLILIVAFTIGGLGGFFKQINIAGGSDELSTVQSTCQNSCNKAQVVTTVNQFKASDYCKKTYSIDLNKDGKINATSETGIRCYMGGFRYYAKNGGADSSNPLGGMGPNVPCSITIGETFYSVDAVNASVCLL